MHVPVLLQPIVQLLAVQAGERVLDATINRGGHARVLGEALGAGGHLIGIDADADALAEAEKNLADLPCQQTFLLGNFRHLERLLQEAGITTCDAILFDLGFSSEELEKSGRGFTFQKDEPLLMTFNKTPAPADLTAASLLADWDEDNIATIIKAYGEEQFAGRIARGIVEARLIRPLATTFDLVEVIRKSVPVWYTKRRLHFATKTFQALRIAVNDELGALTQGLSAAWSVLAPAGRLAVISFHSLEARLVKDFFRQHATEHTGLLLTKKAIQATYEEKRHNPRARSAQLRIIKKLPT